MVHWKPNVPAVVKVRVAEPADWSGMLPGVPAPPLNVTLCVTPKKLQVTVPPAAMSTAVGSNVRFALALTFALVGYTATVITWLLVMVTPPALAVSVIVVVPTATAVTRPVVWPTVAIPGADEPQVTVATIGDPF